MTHLSKIKQSILSIKKAFVVALPVILFFLLLFYTVIVFFGVQYVLVVSFMTVLFKFESQKKQTPRSLTMLVVIQCALCVLSFVATRNIYTCILLNIAVPFVFVFLQSTQFNQKGYYSSLMGFVFLQLRPVDWKGFIGLTHVMAYAICVIVISLLISSYVKKRHTDFQMARKGIQQLSLLMDEVCHGLPLKQTVEDFIALQQNMQKVTYNSRGRSYLMNGEGKIYYMFTLLFQRSTYFLSSIHQKQTHPYLSELSKLLAQSTDFSLENNQATIEKAFALKVCVEDRSDNIALFMTNFLNLYILILKEVTTIDVTKPQKDWEVPHHEKLFPSIKSRLKFDAFELRFAFRLALVLAFGFTFSLSSGINHAYWLPLNAFLLLQPMYEDSTRRLKNRFIGTCVGCLFLYFILPHFAGTPGHFLVATCMVVCMYCSVPGTWMQALFSTSFALTLASMAMKETFAIELRLTFVCCAIVIVLLVNKFFFPTSATGMFHDNIRKMFHIQQSYVQMLYLSLYKPLDYGVICEALTNFYMLFDQIKCYLQQPKEKVAQEKYEYLLHVFWRMVCKMEQILFLVNNEKINKKDLSTLYDYAHVCDYVLGHIQIMLRMKKEKGTLSIDQYKLVLTIENEPYLSDLMGKYAKDISILYRIVLAHY